MSDTENCEPPFPHRPRRGRSRRVGTDVDARQAEGGGCRVVSEQCLLGASVRCVERSDFLLLNCGSSSCSLDTQRLFQLDAV